MIAGRYDELNAAGLVARSVSLVDPEASTAAEMPVEVKIRYRAIRDSGDGTNDERGQRAKCVSFPAVRQ